MKSSFAIPSAILLSALIAPVATLAQQADGDAPRLEIRDAATHDDLANKMREAQANNPLANYTVDEGPDPTKENRPVDILEDSDIISFNGLTTLVPKRAILAMPNSVRNRVGKHVPGHRVVAWKDFLHSNRGWVSTVEVSRSQAEGRQMLPESVTERISRSTSLIVATYQGGPISVLPPAEEESAEASETPTVE